MSIQNARDFLTRLAKDENLRNGLSGCKTNAERRQFALGAGFDFTGDELKAARSEIQDVELDAIAGGGTMCPLDPGGCPIEL